jgi:hypothetical protein
MNRFKFVFGALVVTAIYSASAQLLFTNLPASITGLQALTNLQAVIYGGNSNFVAVGANEAYTCGSFQSNQTWLNSSSWVTKQISPEADNLDAITLENNIFIATGGNNAVFNAANAVAPAGLVWSTNAFHIFPSTVVASGIAYNSNVLVAVAEADQISYSGTNLPTAAVWPAGSTPGGFNFIESFRGVAPYGASGFVACGIYGDIRFSSNGSNWQAKANGAVGESDLFGIASAGQTLVSVGATNGGAANNGGILYSTDGGTAWQLATNPPGGLHPLNAVAYTSPGFIAVGNNGQVLTSPNGIGWTLLTNTVSATNLNGVAFATNGLMAGVGELVGNSGTVILAGYAPQAPTNAIGQTNCATYPNPPNNELSANVVTDANHPAGTVTVDWYDALGHLLTNGTTTFFPTNNPNLVTSNAPVTFTFNAVERDLRTGFTSAATPVTLEINPRPAAILTPLNTTDCNVGDSFVLTNTLTGIGPWTVYWNDGTVQTASGSGPVTLTRTVFPTNTFANMASNNVYYVTSVSNADMCIGNLPGDIIGTNTITINPRPTATLTPFNITDCNEGNSFPLNVTLTGIGPWTVFWNDGTVQTANGAAPLVLTRTVFPTNSFAANTASNNVYFVTVVSNDDTCEGNQPGDITGTNTIIINPLPTATLTSLNTTDCNVGDSFVLTNILTGIGPWTVTWNDGTVQPFGAPGEPGPLPFSRTVSPTNTLANTASNNVYYVTSVSNADMCIGNQPGDIAGTNSIVINPRPTSSLAPLSITNCNNGSSFILTDTLTGIGPWVVTWNDGTMQTNSQIAGPATLLRTVSPTNLLANAASNNVYYVTSVADSTCTAQSEDITGTNLIIINPLPTATLTISTNDFAVSTNGVSSGLLETVSNPSGSTYNLTVGFQYLQNGAPGAVTSQTLSVTNHLTFTGIGPWTVVLSDGSQFVTNTFSGSASYVWQETISTNSDTNFTFSVQSVQSTNTGCSEAPTASYDVLVYDAPTAFAYTTNTVCGSATNVVTISAALGGFGPWTNVVWSDGFTNALVTSNPLNRTVPTPANGTLAQIITNYTIVSLTDMFGATTTSSNDLTGSAEIIVDPYSSSPPVAQSSLNESCATVPIPLSVTVPAGFTANWFDINTNLLTNAVTAYTPPAPAVATTNIYLVAEIYNDTNLNDGCDSPFAVITNIFENCSKATSISLTGTNVVISWNGNFILQSTTNLLPPAMWMNVYTGALGPNFLTNSASQPPIDFFRLYSPTN